jgi:membrane protease YdiL (CAAX protease family)
VLVLILVRREQGALSPSVLRDALRLRAPRSPRTGRRGGRTWLVLVPLTLVFGAEEFIPALPHPVGREFAHFLDTHAGHAFFAGSWGWFALTAALLVFNTVLGEELLFRGYLLPRMNDVFGRRDWLANGVLFAVYHLHEPWVILGPLVLPVEAFAAKRYRSTLVSMAVHSVQTAFVLAIVLSLGAQGLSHSRESRASNGPPHRRPVPCIKRPIDRHRGARSVQRVTLTSSKASWCPLTTCSLTSPTPAT